MSAAPRIQHYFLKEVGNVHWGGKTGQHGICASPLGPYVRPGEGAEAPPSLQALMPADLHPVSHPEQGLCARQGAQLLRAALQHRAQCRDGAGGCSIAPGLLHRAASCVTPHPTPLLLCTALLEPRCCYQGKGAVQGCA